MSTTGAGVFELPVWLNTTLCEDINYSAAMSKRVLRVARLWTGFRIENAGDCKCPIPAVSYERHAEPYLGKKSEPIVELALYTIHMRSLESTTE